MSDTLFVFQAGGPTAVINATLAGVLEAAPARFSQVFGLRHSLELAGKAAPIDLTAMSRPAGSDWRARLARTPGAYLGSSREKVSQAHLAGMLDMLKAHGADHVLGIGGNGTMHALDQLCGFARTKGVDLRIIGVPKTVDNDLPGVAFAPGYGSAARFVALAVRDFDRDFCAMQTFDDVTILETMGRDTGWLAAASVMLKESDEQAPHIVLTPERPVDEDVLLTRIADLHRDLGRVFIVTNEVLKARDGAILGASVQEGPTDSLGRTMYSLSSGTGNYLAGLVWKRLGLQTRCLRPGSLGRAMSCCVSDVDRDLALRVGRAAIGRFDDANDGAVMLTVARDLGLGVQQASLGTGRTQVPDRYFDRGDPFAIAPEFSKGTRAIIGEVEPVLR